MKASYTLALSIFISLASFSLIAQEDQELKREYRQKLLEMEKLTTDYFSWANEKKIEFQKESYQRRMVFEKEVTGLNRGYALKEANGNRRLKQKIDQLTRDFDSKRNDQRKTFKSLVQNKYKKYKDQLSKIKREMRQKLQARDLDYSAFEK